MFKQAMFKQVFLKSLSALLLLCFAVAVQAAIPTYQAKGTARSGTGSVTPTWPTHQAGDVALLFVESAGGQAVTLSSPAGFVAVANSPQSTTASGTSGTRITVFWARATSAAMSNPVVADAGDHVNAQILTYRGVVSSGDPWDATSGGFKIPASTSISVTGVTTSVADTLVVQVAAKDTDSSNSGFSNYANATLTSIVERTDIGTKSGNGGGFSVWDGGKAVAGVVANTTATVVSSVNAFMTIALKPLVVSATTSTVVANPTSVPADGTTSATITVTLKNAAGGLMAGKTVTLAAASGSSVITTVSGVSDANGVATFTVKDAAVEGPISYTATTEGITITQTAQVTFTTTLCFTDDFNRTTGLLATGNWTRTKGAGTTLDAEIVNNRLRLTDATGVRSTAVHLNRLFPGAGNKVTAIFDYISYNGTGGDGVAFTLSDSSIAPVAGAFGGSLGYAQKSNPGSDCTTIGGCPGFAGGWIGVGFDEYGNYANPTEGRVDGPGAGADRVAIRGSGSGLSGYNFHQRSALLAPGVDLPGATVGPNHRYRVTVDHSNGTNAWVTVERDVSATCLIDSPSSCYASVIAQYDAKSFATQASVPANWFLSYTGSTGGSTNVHEIDNMTVCTGQPMIVPTLDHVRIIHDGSALTCAPEPITLKACANANCTALYPGSVTVNLTTSAGTWSANPVTFTGGQATVNLSYATASSAVTIGGTSSKSVVCYEGATSGDCTLAFSSGACQFDAVETGKLPGTPIYTKVAGSAFTLDVLALTAGALNTGYSGAVTVDLVDQTGVAAGSCGTTVVATPTVPPSPTTTATAWTSGRRTYTFTALQAAKDVRVRIVKSAPAATICSSDNFAIRPASFTVTSPTTFPVKTGANFELDASSVVGYSGTALINTAILPEAHVGAVQAGVLSGSFSAASAVDGISKGTTFSYSEVGTFRFKPWGIYDNGGFADVDRSKASPECFSDGKLGTAITPTDPNVKDGNGMYGCYFGGDVASGYFGRFTPDHFDTVITKISGVPMSCASGLTCPALDSAITAVTGMVYSGQGFTTTVIAKNASDVVTQNYEGVHAKEVTLSAAATNGGAALAVSVGTMSANSVPAATFVKGTTSASPATPTFTFATTPASPTDVFMRATDVDSVTSSSKTHEGGVKVVSGRVKLPNIYGSELLPLTMLASAQYYDGLSWVTSLTDSATTLSGILGSYAVGAGTTTVTITPSSGTMSAGVLSIKLGKPAPTGTGKVTVTPTSTATYLPINSGTATFGVYNARKEFIYMRETY